MTGDAVNSLGTLRSLAARIIPDRAPWGQFGQPIVVRPGALPDLPSGFPFPASSHLIGSCTAGTYSEVIADTEQTIHDVLRFYERALGERGWYRHDTQGPSGFLRPGQQADIRVLFCGGPQGPSLWIGGASGPSGMTQLAVTLDTNEENSPCSRPPGARPFRRRGSPFAIPLPALSAPPGATMQEFGTGPGVGSYRVEATMESDLSLNEITRYFGQILEEAGWAPDRGGATGPVSWRSWGIKDDAGEPVPGFLLIVEHEPHLYAVQVDREVSAGARRKAEDESREQARVQERERTRSRAREVDIEAEPTREAIDALRELIVRIGVPPNPYDPDSADPRLAVGRMPDWPGDALPVPSQTTVLGSLVMRGRATIYMESAISPRQVLDFYREHLAPSRWAFFGQRRGLYGFTTANPDESISAQFCPVSDGPALALGVHRSAGGMTEIVIRLNANLDGTPCGNPNAPPGWEYRNTPQPFPPVLAAPEGAIVGSGGGHGGPTSWESRAELLTTLDLSAVAAHYSGQFEAAGWSARDHGRDEVVAWSRCSEADANGPIDAVFVALRLPGAEGYSLIARTTRRPEESRG